MLKSLASGTLLINTQFFIFVRYCFPALFQQSFEDSERNKKTTKEEDEEELPDPVTQLVTMFSRHAQMEQGPQAEDTLYMDYAVIMAK